MSLLVGGLLVGVSASRPGPLRRLLHLMPLAAAATAVRVMVGSRRSPRDMGAGAARLEPADTLPTMTVVVAARDEAWVIGRLVADVAAQDHRAPDGRPLFELLVVDDRSVDGTGQVALRAAAEHGIGEVTRYLARGGSDLPDGKGAALTAAQPDLCHGDVVVVLDADARIEPGFLRALAGYMALGAQGVTPRRRVLGAERSDLAGAQADEQTIDGLIQRARWAWGGCSEFRGNGITVRRDLLAEVGGWRAEALTEDLDLSSRVAAAHGVRVVWAADAEVWEEPVPTWDALWRQRVRWAEGAIRRTLEHGPAVITSPHLSRDARLDFAAYAGQLALPPVLLGTALGALAGRPRALVLVGASYTGLAAALAWDALRWERRADGRRLSPLERLRRTARAVAFGLIWVAAVPAALWRLATREGPVRYDKMTHAASGGSPEAGADPWPPRAGTSAAGS